MGRRPIAISEENARCTLQEGRALKSPPFETLQNAYLTLAATLYGMTTR